MYFVSFFYLFSFGDFGVRRTKMKDKFGPHDVPFFRCQFLKAINYSTAHLEFLESTELRGAFRSDSGLRKKKQFDVFFFNIFCNFVNHKHEIYNEASVSLMFFWVKWIMVCLTFSFIWLVCLWGFGFQVFTNVLSKSGKYFVWFFMLTKMLTPYKDSCQRKAVDNLSRFESQSALTIAFCLKN